MTGKINNLVLCSIVTVVFVCSGCTPESRVEKVLAAYDWDSYVGDKVGIWVSMRSQELLVIDGGQIVKWYPCSTAAAGPGSMKDSGRTPPGWHRIGAKIGDDLLAGAVLVERQWTGRIWTGQQTEEDLILSRILWLQGLEAGKNRGGDVDSKNRYIYIHGTNRIDELGRPASAGCIRLAPQDVIDLYERVDEDCCVLITEE